MWPPATSAGSSACWAITAPGERGRVLERAPHHLRVRDAVAVVGEHAHAEVVELAERRQLLAAPALGDATGDPHVARGPPAALEDRRDHRRVVERRIGVRHADDGGASTERRRPGPALDGFGLLAARLAEVHLDVDEPGRDHAALGVEHGGAGARCEAGCDLGDPSVDDADVGETFARRVDDASAAHEQLGHGRSGKGRVRQSGLRSRAATTGRPSAPRRRSRPVR